MFVNGPFLGINFHVIEMSFVFRRSSIVDEGHRQHTLS